MKGCYCKEMSQVYFYVIQYCFACFEIFFFLHMLPWQPFFQLVTESRNEQNHLDSLFLARLHSHLVRGGGDLYVARNPKSTKNTYYDAIMT